MKAWVIKFDNDLYYSNLTVDKTCISLHRANMYSFLDWAEIGRRELPYHLRENNPKVVNIEIQEID